MSQHFEKADYTVKGGSLDTTCQEPRLIFGIVRFKSLEIFSPFRVLGSLQRDGQKALPPLSKPQRRLEAGEKRKSPPLLRVPCPTSPNEAHTLHIPMHESTCIEPFDTMCLTLSQCCRGR